MLRLPWAKPKPRVLDKRERKQDAAKLERAIALRVRRRDQHRCRICHKPASDVHHIVARSLGGKWEMENLVTLCRDCHCLVQGHAIRLRGNPNSRLHIQRWEE